MKHRNGSCRHPHSSRISVGDGVSSLITATLSSPNKYPPPPALRRNILRFRSLPQYHSGKNSAVNKSKNIIIIMIIKNRKINNNNNNGWLLYSANPPVKKTHCASTHLSRKYTHRHKHNLPLPTHSHFMVRLDLWKCLLKKESSELGLEVREGGETPQAGRQRIPDSRGNETERTVANCQLAESPHPVIEPSSKLSVFNRHFHKPRRTMMMYVLGREG